MNISLLAPCGMNCGVCMAYLRAKNRCPGCRADDTKKPVTRVRCRIKTCPTITQGEADEAGKAQFCFACDHFPCADLKHLDKRYRAKYHMSMIENLEYMKKSGIEEFLAHENKRWTCPECGGTICVHKGECSGCGYSIY